MAEVDGVKMITLWIYLKIKPRGFTYKLVWDVKKKRTITDGLHFET